VEYWDSVPVNLRRKKSKGLPMDAWFLLHNISDMSVRYVSGERKFCCWGGVLQRHHRSQELFSFLERILSRSSPLQNPWSWRSVKGHNTCTVFNKFGSTAINCSRSLQILYCQWMLFCTLQRICSSVATFSDCFNQESLQFWRGLVAACKPVISDFARKSATIARY
jgi:hypothetical protein